MRVEKGKVFGRDDEVTRNEGKTTGEHSELELPRMRLSRIDYH